MKITVGKLTSVPAFTGVIGNYWSDVRKELEDMPSQGPASDEELNLLKKGLICAADMSVLNQEYFRERFILR